MLPSDSDSKHNNTTKEREGGKKRRGKEEKESRPPWEPHRFQVRVVDACKCCVVEGAAPGNRLDNLWHPFPSQMHVPMAWCPAVLPEKQAKSFLSPTTPAKAHLSAGQKIGGLGLPHVCTRTLQILHNPRKHDLGRKLNVPSNITGKEEKKPKTQQHLRSNQALLLERKQWN